MYKKQNCQSCIRRSTVLDSGLVKVKIIVAGQHAYAWSITLIKDNKAQRLEFPKGRVPAMKEYQRLLTQYRQVGDCSLAM